MSKRLSLSLLLLLCLSTAIGLIPQTQAARTAPSAITPRAYLPLVLAGGVTRSIGFAIPQDTGLPTYLPNIQNYQDQMGTHAAILHTPVVWEGMDPLSIRTTIGFAVANNSTPLLMWEPWAGQNAGFGPLNCQTNYSLDNINSGIFDTYIRNTAREIGELGHVVFIAFAHEMNLNEAAWSGACNGGANGGTIRYIAAYQRVHNLFAEQGATNVRWVWTPNPTSFPNEAWNQPDSYYPGDGYVDYIGTKAFNWGASSNLGGRRWQTLNDLDGAFLDQMATLHPTKRQMIVEAASVDNDGGSRAAWILGCARDRRAASPDRGFYLL